MSWNVGAGLEDKGVVVTGAAGGIGQAVVAAFAAAGARVCGIDLRHEAVEQVVSALERGERHLAIGADLTDLRAHEVLLRRALDTFGRFDVLAHLAAVLRRRYDIDEISEEDWDFQLDVNLKAGFFLNRTAAKLFREQGRGGRLINLTSQGWWTGGFGGSVAYAASKGGIVSMSRGLARTLAPYEITVNTVAPGNIFTDRSRQASLKTRIAQGMSEGEAMRDLASRAGAQSNWYDHRGPRVHLCVGMFHPAEAIDVGADRLQRPVAEAADQA